MNIKKTIWTSLAFLLMAGIFNMLCFWLVDDYTKSFYISIGFGNGSLLMLALSSILMSRKGRYIYLSVQDSFIIGGYTVISVLLNLIFALARMNNEVANWIVNIILLAIDLIVLFFVFASTAGITAQLEYDRRERNAFYDLKDRAEALLNKSSSRSINKLIESLYDKIGSCQINRAVNVSDIDSAILAGLDDVQVYLASGSDEEIIRDRIARIMTLVDERNRRITNSIKR